MSQELQDSGIQELTTSNHSAHASPATANWLRLVYVLEYLLGLQVVLSLWTEVGGPGHMDLIPWYLKLACIALEAYYIVRFTAATVENARLWNRNSRIYFGGMILLAALMGGITFYYHLHETPEPQESEETATKAVLKQREPGHIHLL